MAPGARRLKRESTAPNGLMTPSESMYSAGSVTPKREIDSESVSDVLEDPFQGKELTQQDGLPIIDEGYQSMAQRRSGMLSQHRKWQSLILSGALVSVPTSQAPVPGPSSQYIDPMAEEAQATKGLELVGQKVKILVDAISELRNFGLDHVVQLPELVLVGDQSHGKSSLMSALTEVQLPKDQGITTKCPTNIKTSPAETWSCQVSLQQHYKYEFPGPRNIDLKRVTKARPFPPWTEQPLVVKKFKTITDKSELEEVIKWAQIALLNHDEDYRLFIPGSGRRASGDFEQERNSTEAKFSPNVIFIEISGPGLPALSFYDLPGIIMNTGDPKDNYLVKVIENLAIKYIDRPNALIIWTLAMKGDPSNSNTGKVIQNCKAASRCVGVLTNPDHVAARHLDYEKMLLRKAHIVRHGYYVTKQPGDDSSLSGPDYHAMARQEEAEFFDTHHLWTGEWAEFRSRCGTGVIQEFLSTQLATQILHRSVHYTLHRYLELTYNSQSSGYHCEGPEANRRCRSTTT